MTITVCYQSALLETGWARDVRVTVNAAGDISAIETDVVGAQSGVMLPGICNVHSHAHQRAMAGLAERAGTGADSFWTWRDTMYQFVQALQPQHLHAIAAQLYLELLSAGYTRVAEFQYVHHQPNGQPYANPAELSLQTLYAAQKVGIGITNLPVQYQFSGFGGAAISAQQRRFYNEPEAFLRIVESLQAASANNPNTNVGVAGHSLRATNVESFSQVLNGLTDATAPIHMHIAEQVKEVEECITWSGQRPVEYCLDHFAVNERWCLVHATHMTPDETRRLAHSGAVAGLCPTTEANLGDGFFNATDYLRAGGAMGIGSDSHISTSPVEELRWLEYGQRLLHHSRNQLAGGPGLSTGRTLLEAALRGGAQACAHNSGALAVGKRADFIVLEDEHPLLIGRAADTVIDSWIFSGNSNPVRDVYVGGKHLIRNGQHAQQGTINAAFRTAVRDLHKAL